MKKVSPHAVKPLVDKYYVYALFKPNSPTPFYVGKGKGDRVNQHFKPSCLKSNTPKNNTIKKYGNSIKREILCYFDDEANAYKFEEYLISYYGIDEDGGCLVNYAKTRFQYADKFSKVASNGSKFRKRKYPDNIVIEMLSKFFFEGVTTSKLCSEYNIPKTYLISILKGIKCKHTYRTFLETHSISVTTANDMFISKMCYEEPESKKTTSLKIGMSLVSLTYEQVVSIIKDYTAKKATQKELATRYGVSESSISALLCGDVKTYANLVEGVYVPEQHFRFSEQDVKEMVELRKSGYPLKHILSKFDVSKTHFYRLLKQHGMKTSGAGTSTDGNNVASGDTNLENTG